jgi:ferredoxin-NADP reductase
VSLVTVPVEGVIALTPRCRLLTFDIRRQRLEFLAGQAVMAAPQGQTPRRPYSIACSPERAGETGLLELLIAIDDQKGFNLSGAVAGTMVDLEGPVGAFTLPATLAGNRLLFVAAGTGIAPLRAMLDHALRRYPGGQISVLYSARSSDEFPFIDELRSHQAAGRVELHQTVTRDTSATWDGGRGRLGRSHFETVIHEPAATLCFVCGPAPFVAESRATLKALGVPEAQIRTERGAAGS